MASLSSRQQERSVYEQKDGKTKHFKPRRVLAYGKEILREKRERERKGSAWEEIKATRGDEKSSGHSGALAA